jgi:hypothetical protein
MIDTVSNPSIHDPELVHGSLITLRRKCGKASRRRGTTRDSSAVVLG